MNLSDFDFHLPEDLIAKQPLEKRSSSKLLCHNRKTKSNINSFFHELTKYLSPNDLLVFNDTKVIQARIFGKKSSGANIECLIERFCGKTATCMVKGKNLKVGTQLLFSHNIEGEIITDHGQRKTIIFNENIPLIMQKIGTIPIPPYFKRAANQNDKNRYQTIYAKKPGAIAAPTAGLHFDEHLMQKLKQQGIKTTKITLHVGAGTFQPVLHDDITQHVMHSEQYEVSQESANIINKCKQQGNRVIAVGTTVVRTLETIMQNQNQITEQKGDSNIFITPGFDFKCVDALITNFHLPKSTLLMLVSALMGHEEMYNCYQQAIHEKYRFYSYGDAMLII